MRVKSLLLASALALLLPTGEALAAPCAGFTDVQDTDFFCPSVEWLKNRGITLGCTASAYCPNDPVIRAQMALFMDRLGTALTPSFAVIEGSGAPTVVDLDVETFSCVSAVYTITDFPRTAVIRAHFSGLFAGAAAYGMTMRYNTDGNGATFPNFVNGNFEFAGATGATWGAASTSAVLPLAVGSTYRFAIRTIRYGAGTFDLADFRCHLLVEIQNRRGASSPFDAAPQVSSSPDEL